MKLFEGTFYWHNQAGIFLAAGAVLGLGAIAAGRPVALLGWTVTPLCVAGTVFTTSRGSQMALALAVVLLLVLLRRRHLHVLGGLALAWGVTVALSGPPFFTERIAPTAATQARAASLVGNGVQRIEDWRRAFRIFEHWPFSGAGFNSFASATDVATTRHDRVGTAFAHNGYLQAAADGGLVLIVPLVVLLALVLLAALRGLPGAVRSRDAVRLGALCTLVALLLHSGMDFDWGYPALLAMLAPVAVLALPPAVAPATPSTSAARRAPSWVGPWVGPALAVLGIGLLVLGAVAGWGGGLDLNAPV
nr:O-antigen ligase family protein [Nocardioides panaciterrulae]